jgi:hypothetical protein
MAMTFFGELDFATRRNDYRRTSRGGPAITGLAQAVSNAGIAVLPETRASSVKKK